MNTFAQACRPHLHAHTRAQAQKKKMVHRPGGGGVRLMYFDDMKVDHIYMQIEVPD